MKYDCLILRDRLSHRAAERCGGSRPLHARRLSTATDVPFLIKPIVPGGAPLPALPSILRPNRYRNCNRSPGTSTRFARHDRSDDRSADSQSLSCDHSFCALDLSDAQGAPIDVRRAAVAGLVAGAIGAAVHSFSCPSGFVAIRFPRSHWRNRALFETGRRRTRLRRAASRDSERECRDGCRSATALPGWSRQKFRIRKLWAVSGHSR